MVRELGIVAGSPLDRPNKINIKIKPLFSNYFVGEHYFIIEDK